MSQNNGATLRNDEIFERLEFGEDIEDLAEEYGMTVAAIQSMYHYRKKREAKRTAGPALKLAELKKYIKRKIKFLEQFNIILSKKELEHMNSLKSEIEVDNFARDLFNSVRTHVTTSENKLQNQACNLQFLVWRLRKTKHEVAKDLGLTYEMFKMYYYGYRTPKKLRRELFVKYFNLKSYDELFMDTVKFKKLVLTR